MPARQVESSSLAILLIDAQPLFWKQMHGPREPVLVRLEQLLTIAEWFGLPLIATFEHPVETKGWLPESLERIFPHHGHRFVKRTFNCCEEPTIRRALEQLSAKQVALSGAETDVCVLQSALGLQKMGYEVFLLEDCLFTSEPHPGPALDRMYQAGVIPCTYKMLYYELTRTVDENVWPREWQAGRSEYAARIIVPEELLPWEPTR